MVLRPQLVVSEFDRVKKSAHTLLGCHADGQQNGGVNLCILYVLVSWFVSAVTLQTGDSEVLFAGLQHSPLQSSAREPGIHCAGGHLKTPLSRQNEARLSAEVHAAE